jgi:hypothetical protein
MSSFSSSLLLWKIKDNDDLWSFHLWLLFQLLLDIEMTTFVISLSFFSPCRCSFEKQKTIMIIKNIVIFALCFRHEDDGTQLLSSRLFFSPYFFTLVKKKTRWPYVIVIVLTSCSNSFQTWRLCQSHKLSSFLPHLFAPFRHKEDNT